MVIFQTIKVCIQNYNIRSSIYSSLDIDCFLYYLIKSCLYAILLFNFNFNKKFKVFFKVINYYKLF